MQGARWRLIGASGGGVWVECEVVFGWSLRQAVVFGWSVRWCLGGCRASGLLLGCSVYTTAALQKNVLSGAPVEPACVSDGRLVLLNPTPPTGRRACDTCEALHRGQGPLISVSEQVFTWPRLPGSRSSVGLL